MRKLTVKREKTFVGCVMQVTLYIHDEDGGDKIIEGTSCRKLGRLKNGEEKTFAIGDGECKIYAIVDELSKNYCNDSKVIPAGTEDVRLTGKNRFVLGSNPFTFDGEVTEDVLRSRKKKSRKALVIFVASILIGLLIGWLIGGGVYRLTHTDEPKTFLVEEMQITMPGRMQPLDQDAFTAVFGYRDMAVLILKEAFSDYEGLEDYTLQEYGQLTIDVNSLPGVLENTEGLTFFEYDATGEDGNAYHYIYAVYQSEAAFWSVQFGSLKENAEEYRPEFMQWAKSVRFAA